MVGNCLYSKINYLESMFWEFFSFKFINRLKRFLKGGGGECTCVKK